MSLTLRAAGAALGAAALVLAVWPAAATHGDYSYDQPLFFEWGDRPLLVDLYVIPPEHGQVVNSYGFFGGMAGSGALVEADPCRNSYTTALRDAVGTWTDAIDEFAAEWLEDAVTLRVTVAGCDSASPGAALGAEIVVFTDQSKATVYGLAFMAEPCLVNVSKFFLTSFSYEDMFNLGLHEIGHCLGLAHVGGDHPAHDVMDGVYDDSPGQRGTHHHCPSNLNVYGLQSAFGRSLDQAGGYTVSLPVWFYEKLDC